MFIYRNGQDISERGPYALWGPDKVGARSLEQGRRPKWKHSELLVQARISMVPREGAERSPRGREEIRGNCSQVPKDEQIRQLLKTNDDCLVQILPRNVVPGLSRSGKGGYCGEVICLVTRPQLSKSSLPLIRVTMESPEWKFENIGLPI